MSEMFTIQQVDFGVDPDKNSSCEDYSSVVGGTIAKQTHLGGADELLESGNINLPRFELGQCQDNTTVEELLRDQYQQELQEEKRIMHPSPALKILNSYGRGFTQLDGEKVKTPNYDIECTKLSGQKLSTDEILRLGGEKFIQCYSQASDEFFGLEHFYSSAVLGLPDEEVNDMELVQCLLASAEKVGQQQYEHASMLINLSNGSNLNRGSPVQRIVYYFFEALQEKIDREIGGATSDDLVNNQSSDVLEAMMSPDAALIAYFQKIPFIKVSQFSAVQAIIENVGEAQKVHIIDLEIRGGTQCTVLMQGLAARVDYPLEHLKITAIGTRSKSKIEETGKRLMSFAQSMNLPFSFNVVMVADMLDLNEGLFELDAGVAVAVYAPYVLYTMIHRPDRLECLMRVMRNINPCVMVVIELEAKLNSPVFVNRFLEALFFYGAFFDSLGDVMHHDETNRMMLESIYLSQVIRNIVAAEGEERIFRHVNIKVWGAFFARFGMVEIDLITSSLYQAHLLLNNFACGSSCTLGIDGKSLTIGWKGAPIYSISAWKFQ
ncbi:unnamed protein product [Ilex paraguariensis]|uniref:DELLA protein RGL1 n=1 Tax=Ilex paraguariensis TaxID=185542 RepID=A0ABC8R8E5_9AQUA